METGEKRDNGDGRGEREWRRERREIMETGEERDNGDGRGER